MPSARRISTSSIPSASADTANRGRPPMTADSFKDAVVTFLRDHQSLAEPIVFALGFAEGIPLLSWFVPSSALFLAIGSLYGGAGGDIYRLWAAAAAGAVVGDCVTY